MTEKNDSTVTDIDESIINIDGGDKVETIIKKLLDKKHLPFITELTHEQIVEICKLKHIAKKYGNDNFPKLNKKYPIEKVINEFIENFMLHMTSLKRQRVREFLDGLKSERNERSQQPNFISKVLGK